MLSFVFAVTLCSLCGNAYFSLIYGFIVGVGLRGSISSRVAAL